LLFVDDYSVAEITQHILEIEVPTLGGRYVAEFNVEFHFPFGDLGLGIPHRRSMSSESGGSTAQNTQPSVFSSCN
jgi:hypothetical protein